MLGLMVLSPAAVAGQTLAVTGSGEPMWTVAFGAAALLGSCVGHLSAARTLASRERERAVAEAEAFDVFISRVESLSPVTVDRGASSTQPCVIDSERADGADTAAVREAYRETVMEVDHFDTYGESFLENVRAELGDDAAQWLARSHSLSAVAQQSVRQRAATMRAQRRGLANFLDDEVAALDHHADELESIAAELDELHRAVDRGGVVKDQSSISGRLDRVKERLDDRHKHRQREHQESGGVAYLDGDYWATIEWVYAPLPVRFPVLDACVDLRERLTEERRFLRTGVDL
jgi:hypothetical protein